MRSIATIVVNVILIAILPDAMATITLAGVKVWIAR